MKNDSSYISPLEITSNAEKTLNESIEKDIKKEAKVDNRPSILFCCPGSILDITSGAALSLRSILNSLANRGFRAIALQATIFDSAQGGEHVMEAGKPQKDKPIWRTVINNVEHLIIKTSNPKRQFMIVQEEETFIQMFRNELKFRRPDMIFLWGSLVLERTIMREARDANIPVIFYLVNPGYKDLSVFKDVDIIITDTKATAKFYKDRFNFDLKVVGKFIGPELISTVERKPEFFTFINPSFEKGVSVFMPLAKLMAKEHPEIKFLVVQSRGRWANALHVFKFDPKDFPNVKVINHQHDMRPVYGSTRTLLLPSLWHESGARVIAEAHLNGIPILASDTGGSSELIGKGGKIFKLAEDVLEKKGQVVVTESSLREWMEEIVRLYNDQNYYDEMCKHVLKERIQHDIEKNTDKFILAVDDAVKKSKNKSTENKDIIKQALKKKQARLNAKKIKK
jgi:glycosyltransferase involved in cell wall biosynthesis